MNATTPARLRIVAANAHTLTIEPYGFPMECEFEFYPGEAAILSPADYAHPGAPDNAQLLACKVGGVDIVDMLSNSQRERIEEQLISEMEST